MRHTKETSAVGLGRPEKPKRGERLNDVELLENTVLLTTEEVRRLLRMSRATFERYLKRTPALAPIAGMGQARRFHTKDVREHIEQQRALARAQEAHR